MDEAEPKLNEIPAPGPFAFTTSFEIGKIAEALAKAQGQMKAAEFDRENPGFHFRYATIASIWEAIRGPLSANNLAVTQIVSNGDLVTMLIHSSGQWFRSVSKILAKDQSAQGFGSGMTYARRYCLQAIVGAASADEDDDGNEASKATGKAAMSPSRLASPARPTQPAPKAPETKPTAQEQFDGLPSASGSQEAAGAPEKPVSTPQAPEAGNALNAILNLAKKKGIVLTAKLREWHQAGTYSAPSLPALQPAELEALKKWLQEQPDRVEH